MIEALLRRAADPNTASARGSTALHLACERNKDAEALVGFLFEICDELGRPVDVAARDKAGDTAMHVALTGVSKKRMIEALLRRAADPNTASARGSTALHLACERNKDDLRRVGSAGGRRGPGQGGRHSHARGSAFGLLLGRGADPNSRNRRDETPLHIVAQRDDFREILWSEYKANNDDIGRFIEVSLRAGAEPNFLHHIA
uniref:Uncharacterized protein n=1 Tax=Trichogramma kaykai TaxID=54128 RepID=A0ABD2XGD4_9HYME